MAERVAFDTSVEAVAPHEMLSERELQVFKLLAQGLGVNEIAAMLFISSKTVSTHKCRMIEKMDLKTNAELVRYALEHNLLR
jgi:DNA-binding NarL/FixJ family response regulator